MHLLCKNRCNYELVVLFAAQYAATFCNYLHKRDVKGKMLALITLDLLGNIALISCMQIDKGLLHRDSQAAILLLLNMMEAFSSKPT